MTDKETADHIRRYAADLQRKPLFAWPTDGCGYEQHMRFVHFRNTYWTDVPETDDQPRTFEAFLLDYADRLERGEIPPHREGEAS